MRPTFAHGTVEPRLPARNHRMSSGTAHESDDGALASPATSPCIRLGSKVPRRSGRVRSHRQVTGSCSDRGRQHHGTQCGRSNLPTTRRRRCRPSRGRSPRQSVACTPGRSRQRAVNLCLLAMDHSGPRYAVPQLRRFNTRKQAAYHHDDARGLDQALLRLAHWSVCQRHIGPPICGCS